MRCPNCSKMVSYGDPEVEIQNEGINSDIGEGKETISGNMEITARLMLPCGDCSTELKETAFDFETQFEHHCPKPLSERNPEVDEEDLTFDIEAEGSDRYQNTDPKGKAIPFRYQKHYYVASIHVNITCPFCKETIEVSDSDECQASGMDELV